MRFDVPEVSDVEDDALTLRWNKVDVPAFSMDDEPLSFMIERQSMPGYHWEPVAANLTGTSYRIRDLKPYQDYAFRVRGVYPSGYTEPSPYVPVYRRPSESKLSLACRNISSFDSIKLQTSANQNLPTQSLRASLPSEFSPFHRNMQRERTARSYSNSPQRRYSMPYIFNDIDTKTTIATEKSHTLVRSESPGFRLKDAYVYNRRKSEDIIPDIDILKPSYASAKKDAKVKTLASEFEGVRSRAFARRHSDVGLGIPTRHHSLPRDDISRYYDSDLEERKLILRNVLMHKSFKPRSSSVPKFSTPLPESTEKYPYRSVADRYEDIKLKYISKTLSHDRPHSVSLDTYDYKKYTAPEHRPVPGRYVPTSYTDQRYQDVEYIRPEYDYYDGTFFIIEDEMNLDYKVPLPRVSRVDMKLPTARRSISYERDPGYLMISKFSLLVSGARPLSPIKAEKPLTGLRNTSRSSTPVELLRSRVKARSLTPDLGSYKERSRSFSPSMKQYSAKGERKRAMSFTSETYQASVNYKQASLAAKPRSNSISVPSPSRQTVSSQNTMAKCRAPAAILIDKSRSLIGRYEEVPGGDRLAMSRSDSFSPTKPPPLNVKASSRKTPSTDRAKTSILIDQSKSLIDRYQNLPGEKIPDYNLSARRYSVTSSTHASILPLSHESVVPRKSSVAISLSRPDLQTRSKSLQPRSKSLSVPPRSRGSVVDSGADQLRLKLDALVGKLCTPAAKKKHYTPKVTCSRMRAESAAK